MWTKEMSLSDWQKAKMYATRRCSDESKRTGKDIRWAEYTLGNGRKGIRVALFDDGKLFNEWYSGVYETYMDFKDCFEIQLQRALLA